MLISLRRAVTASAAEIPDKGPHWFELIRLLERAISASRTAAILSIIFEIV